MSHQKADYLALLHFSKSKPLTCALVSGTIDNFFTVKLNEPMDPFNDISKGDPVTFGKIDKDDKGNEVKIFGGFALSKADEDELTISPDMSSFDVERRKSTRHPVSIFGYIKHGLRKEKSLIHMYKGYQLRRPQDMHRNGIDGGGQHRG